MNMYSLKLYFIILLFILILNVKSKEISNNIKNYINNSLFSDYDSTGVVLTKYLKNSEELELQFYQSDVKLFHFISFDCEFQIESEKIMTYIKKINYYNYNASYILSNLDDDLLKLKIIPLIHSTKEQKQNRNYLLIINSVLDSIYTPSLNIKENEPIFLYFNNDLKNISLYYKVLQNNSEYPIIISFFIKDKIKFKIVILDTNKKVIINRIINYKENIVIKPDSLASYKKF